MDKIEFNTDIYDRYRRSMNEKFIRELMKKPTFWAGVIVGIVVGAIFMVTVQIDRLLCHTRKRNSYD